ncbi:MAG: penicillin-binding transpeptidase domain-containing protein [Nannocystales bacterium]
MAACAATPSATETPQGPAAAAAPTSEAGRTKTDWAAAVSVEAEALQAAHPGAEVRIAVLDDCGQAVLARHGDIDVAKPTGSSIKPLAIHAALGLGLDPALEVDASAPLKVGDETIKDSRNNGVLSLSEAIAKSSNIAVARALQTVDWKEAYARVGTLVSLPSPEGLSLRDAIGQLDGFKTTVPLHELVSAYAQMASTSHGEAVLDMLRLAVTPEGTGSAAVVEGLEVLGKTGTSRIDDVQGAVFVGRVRDGEKSAWIGVSVHGVAEDAYGGTVCAPAFAHIAKAVLR